MVRLGESIFCDGKFIATVKMEKHLAAKHMLANWHIQYEPWSSKHTDLFDITVSFSGNLLAAYEDKRYYRSGINWYGGDLSLCRYYISSRLNKDDFIELSNRSGHIASVLKDESPTIYPFPGGRIAIVISGNSKKVLANGKRANVSQTSVVVNSREIYSGSSKKVLPHPYGVIIMEKNKIFLNEKQIFEGHYDDCLPYSKGIIVRRGDVWRFFGSPKKAVSASQNQEYPSIEVTEIPLDADLTAEDLA